MGTVIRSEISTKNKYHISKHKYFELKHFCLQYNELIKERNEINYGLDEVIFSEVRGTNQSSVVESKAARIYDLDHKINLIMDTAMETDSELYAYILKGVTEERPYEYLQTMLQIPCCRDTYYDRYRKFYYLLSQKR